MIELSHALCSNENVAGEREWLVTNGIGGFASGTVAGFLTRRYHGLLFAALQPPLGRTLLVSKLDETLYYGRQVFPITSNVWRDNIVDPKGFIHLDRFHLEGTTPVWTYRSGDLVFEKSLWMLQGENTTCVRYRVLHGRAPVRIQLKALVNYRDYHGVTRAQDWNMDIQEVKQGIAVRAFEGASRYFIYSPDASFRVNHDWHRDFFLRLEAYRGLDTLEDHLQCATLSYEFGASDTLDVLLTTEARTIARREDTRKMQAAHESNLLSLSPLADEPAPIPQLVLAADQFIVKRGMGKNEAGHSVIAGYPWFSDWGRDTMIALPGLTLSTGRHDIARSILRTFARHVDQGMLPNRFPDAGEKPEYNTVDATLWYLEAIRAYVARTDDSTLLKELFPVLESIIDHHIEGTRYGIRMDPADHLIFAGEEGVQLTWMDAKAGDWVVTPRIGKPVEINALWYHALVCMTDFARQVNQSGDRYETLSRAVKKSFSRYWLDEAGYCYDVLDTPTGNDASLRPNQLFAVSLLNSPLSKKQQMAVVDRCSEHLLTPFGLRSLAPGNPQYKGVYGGGPYDRDGSYHQGTVWAWLLGPYLTAHLRVYKNPALVRELMHPLLQHLTDHCMGSISEIFDGNPPHKPRGAYAQAWSVAEVLRLWEMTT